MVVEEIGCSSWRSRCIVLVKADVVLREDDVAVEKVDGVLAEVIADLGEVDVVLG